MHFLTSNLFLFFCCFGSCIVIWSFLEFQVTDWKEKIIKKQYMRTVEKNEVINSKVQNILVKIAEIIQQVLQQMGFIFLLLFGLSIIWNLYYYM